MTEPLYLNDTIRVRNSGDTTMEYSMRLYNHTGLFHELTKTWGEWKPLLLHDSAESARNLIDEDASSWFFMYQINGRYGVFDLRQSLITTDKGNNNG